MRLKKLIEELKLIYSKKKKQIVLLQNLTINLAALSANVKVQEVRSVVYSIFQMIVYQNVNSSHQSLFV